MSVVLLKLGPLGTPSRAWDGRRTFRDEETARAHLAELRRLGDRATYQLAGEVLLPPPERELVEVVPEKKSDPEQRSGDITRALADLWNEGVTDYDELATRVGIPLEAVCTRLGAARKKGLISEANLKQAATYTPRGKVGEVYRLLGRGKGLKEISAQLGMPLPEIKQHVYRLRRQGLLAAA